MSQTRFIIDNDLIPLSQRVINAVEDATALLTIPDLNSALKIITLDKEIDTTQIDIEKNISRLIASSPQITQLDAGYIPVSVTILAELERIGDYASAIARSIHKLQSQYLHMNPYKDSTPEPLLRMAKLALHMLQCAVSDISANSNPDSLAIEQDEQTVNALRHTLVVTLTDAVVQQRLHPLVCVEWLQIGNMLERTADRALEIHRRLSRIFQEP